MSRIEKHMDKMDRKGEKKGMELWLKIVLALAGAGCAGLVVFGVNSLNAAKESEVQQIASNAQVIVEVQDSTIEQTETEQIVEVVLEDEYKKEAEALWNQHSEEVICTNEEFVSKYIDYRNNELSAEVAWNSLYNEFAKENQAEFNEQGEVVATDEALEAVINSTDENIEEPVVEQTEAVEVVENIETVENVETVDFVVEDVEPCQLYATQSVNIRKGPSASDFDKIGSLSLNQRVTVTGIVKEYKGETVLWYRLEGSKGNIGYASGAYLSEKQVQVVESKPAEKVVENQQSSNQTSENTGSNNGNSNNSVGGFVIPEGGSIGNNMQFGGQANADSGYTGNVELQ